MKKRYVLPIPILILLAVIAGFTLGTLDQTLAEWAERLLTYVRGLGAWGPIVIVVTMMVVCVTSLPGAPLTLGCGFLFGVWKGTLIATAGATLGASAAYILGRTFARNWVKRSISRRARFARLDRATQHHGFTIVLLSRLSPLFPFNLLNYAFSVTAVKFRDYFVATMLGVIPACFVWVYMGTFMKTIAEVATGKVDPATVKPWVLVLSLVITLIAMVILAYVAKRMLARALAEEVTPEEAAEMAEALEGTSARHASSLSAEELGEDLFESSKRVDPVDPAHPDGS
ncbi:MAG: TVP38/TMEM64 family protein [Gemmatimonadetes bacterium]|nr:TVP38/TMEM64 family protein [Gemmatimonadota bacterium]